MATLLDAGWVTMDVAPQIPTVQTRPGSVTYGPLADTPVEPDVVLVRVNGKQLMVLADALPGLRIDFEAAVSHRRGREGGRRRRGERRLRVEPGPHGMPATDMTCAIPGARLAEVVDAVNATAAADTAVGGTRRRIAKRFA